LSRQQLVDLELMKTMYCERIEQMKWLLSFPNGSILANFHDCNDEQNGRIQEKLVLDSELGLSGI
jgi:hypothetical protein